MRTTAASSMFAGDQQSTTLNTENSSPHFNKEMNNTSSTFVKSTTTPGSRNQNLGPSGVGGANHDEGDSDSGADDAGGNNNDKKKKKKNKKKNKKKTANEGAEPERQSRPLEQA